MSEYIKFDCNGEEVEVTPETATLYTYRKLGKAGLNLSIYDHIFVELDDDTGYYLFMTGTPDETKQGVQQAMIDKGYTCFLNQDDVAQCDIKAFDDILIRRAMEDTDHVPESWNE